MFDLTRFLLAPALLVALAPLATPDTVKRTDGTLVQSVTVESEALTGVVYKPTRGEAVTLPIDRVESIRYDRRPRAFDEAAVHVADNSPDLAYLTLKTYVDAQLENPSDERRFPWAAPTAARQALDIARARQQWDDVMAMSDVIIRRFPNSRHVPDAYLARADALALQGKRQEAEQALTALATLVEQKSLPASYALQTRLARARVNPALKPDLRLTELEAVSKAAEKDHPRVFANSLVARGETYLEIGFDQKDRQAEMIQRARQTFEQATAAPGASEATKAGAMTGLAECYFLAAGQSDSEQIKRARDLYLRVAVLYPDQTQYAARALFSAARCFDMLDEENAKQRAQRLFREVRNMYPDTTWAEQARRR